MEEPTRYRYCRVCDEEFRPDIERCSDCGGALEDRYEGMTVVEDPAREDAGGDLRPLDLDPRSFVPLHTAEDSTEAAMIARRLSGAGIAYSVTAQPAAHSFTLNVPEEALDAAKAHVPRKEPVTDGFDAERGYERCPACGQDGVAGLEQCPECGLTLAGDQDAEPPRAPSGETD